ncbi:MAG: sigma-70 family RNA polymerase sigma factor [Bacteroidota bacterium]
MAASMTYSEKELVEGCIDNDRRCQEALYRKFFPTMMRMCMRYAKDEHIAVEIVNIGMLRVFKKLDTFSFKGSLEGWVRRLVFHALSDYYKKHTKPVHFLELADRDEPVPASSLSDLYLEDILNLVDLLPDASRKVFQLYAIEGYTHVEIGKMLGISDGTSKWHLSAARKKMKQLIKQHYNTRNYAG